MTAKEICKAIAAALPNRIIEHHEPSIGYRELEYITDCVGNDPVGFNYIRLLEQRLADYCGTEQAVAVNSGTAALHLALLATGVKPNEEVLLPTLTFAGCANAVIQAGAIPHFVDGKTSVNAHKLQQYLGHRTEKTEDKRGRLNPKTNRVISAFIGVDLLGFPSNWPKLTEVAEEFGLIVIEDAAQALGSKLGNQWCGSYGRAAILSFNSNKIVTGNGGGAVLTNDPWISAQVHRLSTMARIPHQFHIQHDAVAFNYRMSNITAALITAQLEQIDDFLAAKQELVSKYTKALSDCEEVSILSSSTEEEHPNYWLISAYLNDTFDGFKLRDKTGLRDQILTGLHDKGIKARALFTPLHKLEIYKECPRQFDLCYAEDFFERIICLPSGVGLV